MPDNIIIRNSEELKGVFYYDDVKYKIIAVTGHGNITQLSHYQEAIDYWHTASGKQQVLIKFEHPILITNYSIIKCQHHSYPESFILYGKQNGRFVELDKRENQKYNGDDIQAINNLTVTYQTNFAMLTKEVLLKQTKSSCDAEYLLLRGLEFYGVVCKNCRMMMRLTCMSKSRNIVKLTYLIINLLIAC